MRNVAAAARITPALHQAFPVGRKTRHDVLHYSHLGPVAKTLHGLAGAMMFVLLAQGWWMAEFAPRAARFGHYG
jgi:hypothetical protein